MRRLSHTAAKVVGAAPAAARTARAAAGASRETSGTSRETVGAAIVRVARALKSARVHFGHGTDNARDEAAEIVFFAAGLAHDLGTSAYGKSLTARRSA